MSPLKGRRPIATLRTVILLTLAGVVTFACQDARHTSTVDRTDPPTVVEPPTPPPGNLGVAAEAETTVDRSAWTFADADGLILTTENYRIHTTGTKVWMHEYAARFAEEALDVYRTALADLPAPDSPLETFLFAKRDEWQMKTRSLMREHADLYLNLGRGGYATRGTAVLFDIGFNDTFAIMSHEGWHQYTQIAFEDPLPTWLEEGIATYMEGRRQVPGRPVEFDPWANQQRRQALRRAWARDTIIPLAQLVDRSPQYFLEQDSAGLLTYYAQVWALTQFLVHAEGGLYRDNLTKVLEDAAAGRMVSTIMNSPNISAKNQRRRMALSTFGPGVILAYFNRDEPEFEDQYRAFMAKIASDSRFAPKAGKRHP